MLPPPIDVLRVSGSHREVGRQIGEARADRIRADVAFDDRIPAGRSRSQQLELALRYRQATQARLPWLIDELDGCAEGAGVDAMELFAASVEEIWYQPRVSASVVGRCSDLVAGPGATVDGHLLVGHNNDLAPSAEDELVAIERSVPGDPVVFQIGGAPWLSVGFNSAGLALTGNEVSPNDERIGVSRSHQVFEILRERTIDEAVRASLAPDRASSYNNVLTHADGGVVNVEGSATDAELTGLGDDATLAHTNHYVCDRMVRYEGDPDYAVRSARRYERACELLAERRGSITEATMREMLSDHAGAPDCLCRHPDRFGGRGKTVFWCVADVTERRITFGRGNPCHSGAQEYAFG